VFECVINISEGRDDDVLDELCEASGSSLKDLHSDEFHHRSVFTLINDAPALSDDVHGLIAAAYQRLSLLDHRGVHPRFGVVDVVPFVALAPNRLSDAVVLRDELAQWLVANYEVPVFLYGPLGTHETRTLPEVRRGAFTTLEPDLGPSTPSRTFGCVALGARELLVAWNLWLSGVTMEEARVMARTLRAPAIRTLAFEVGDQVQVSCNLVDLEVARPSMIYDEVQSLLGSAGHIERSELVGLAPTSLLEREDPERWVELGLSKETTIEERVANWHA
jgi:glutamate formiminotransferase